MRPFVGVAGVWPYLVAAFVGATVIAFLLTPRVRRFSRRRGLLDRPDPRRVNVRPIPRAGGLAVVGAFLPVALVGVWFAAAGHLGPAFVLASIEPGELVALIAGAAVAAGLGFLDDQLQLRARWQLAGQLGLAGVAVLLGIGVGSVANPLGHDPIRLEGVLDVAFTVFWIVGMINSINFIDGLDGLSSGIGLIAAATLGVISLTTAVGPFGQPLIAVLCFALAGSLLGFLRFNFHPATIFAGTSGTMFLGYTLALLAILGSAKVAVALLVLGVPIIDTFWIIVRRLASGRAPFTPDRGHIHHRLLDLGLNQTQVVVLIYALTAALAILSVVLSGAGQVYAFLSVVLASGLGLFLLTRRSLVAEEFDARSYPDEPDGP